MFVSNESNLGFRRSLSLQFNVIYALLLREMKTRYGDYRLGYAWGLIEPLVQIGIFTVMFSFFSRMPPLGTSYEAFFVTGFIPFNFYRDTASRPANAINSNRTLLTFPPVQNLDVIYARMLLEIITNTAAFLILLIILFFMQVPIVPQDPYLYLFGFLSAIVFGCGFGMINAVISPVFKIWSMISSWILRFQFFLAGIYFLVDRLPPNVRGVLEFNPMTHIIFLVREGFYSGYKPSDLIPLFPITTGLVLFVSGMILERMMRKKLSVIM